MLTLAASTFSSLDWAILAVYVLLVSAIGWMAGRRGGGRDDFFHAGRRIPMWAAAVSVVATSISAATYVGGPQQAYTSNLTYLSTNIGGVIAIVVVAIFFVPAYYRRGVTSVYELLSDEYGMAARRAASAMFLIGRVFASGARLFIVGIPFSLVAFGSVAPRYLVLSIVLVTVVATLYTLVGGMRAVIWTDVVQAAIFAGTVALALAVLLRRIPLEPSEVARVLAETSLGDTSKLTLLDLDTDPSKPYTLWTALFGWSLFMLAAYGVDQDLVQRMLTCRTARSGSWSAALAIVLGWPIVAMFLGVGLLLFIFYQRPDLMGAAAPAYEIDDSRTVFLAFILHEMGPGLRGLMIAGLLAAAMGSFASVLTAMAAATIADFGRPWLQKRHEAAAGRLAVVAWSIVLCAFACGCIWWQQARGETLIDFALSVMVFAYAGLLAVFLAALFTRRGNAVSAIAALLTGFIGVVLLQSLREEHSIATPWQMVIATTASFLVCCLGARKTAGRACRSRDGGDETMQITPSGRA